MRAILLAVLAMLLHATHSVISHAPLPNSHSNPLPRGKPKVNRLANRKVYEAQTAELTAMGYFDALEETLLDIMVHYDNSTLPRPTRAICLGLGTFSTGPRTEPYDPQRTGAQLAAFLHLLDVFDIDAAAAKCHDPRFSARDKAFLRSFNLSLSNSPEEAKADLVSDEPTLFFCPYLNYDVYEQIFKQNWSAARMKNVIIVGSALDGWLNDDHWFRSNWKAYIPRTQRYIPLSEVERLPTTAEAIAELPGKTAAAGKFGSEEKYGLDDLHLHWIPPARVAAMGPRFWNVRKRSDSRWKHPDRGHSKHNMDPNMIVYDVANDGDWAETDSATWLDDDDWLLAVLRAGM